MESEITPRVQQIFKYNTVYTQVLQCSPRLLSRCSPYQMVEMISLTPFNVA